MKNTSPRATSPITMASADTTTMRSESKRDRILIFPFMAQGHTIPLLHLAAALSSRSDLRITVMTTPANAPSLLRCLPSSVDLVILPFPHFPSLPSGCESTDRLPSFDLYPAFLAATTLLRSHFHRHLLHLQSTGSLPLCLISDFFLGWTLDVCRLFNVPRLVFHGMSAFSMFFCKSLWVHQSHAHADSDDATFTVPGAPETLLLTRGEVPDTVRAARDETDPVVRFVDEIGEADLSSWGVVINSFAAVEREYTALFETFYRVPGARAWLVGPLSLFSSSKTPLEDDECIAWLDGKPPGTVLYVSFGTQTMLAAEQLDEVAHGLEAAGCEYLWVVRPTSWIWPMETPRKSGKIAGWAPQNIVLQHKAVGGFLSHCGWNSVMESVAAKVPILAWPMMAEQALNAKLVVDELGVGVRVTKPSTSGGVVAREAIEKGVRELMMGGEKGKKVRERMEELGRTAKEAVGEEGSSVRAMNELVDELRRWRRDGRSSRSSEKEDEVVAVDAIQFELQEGIRIA